MKRCSSKIGATDTINLVMTDLALALQSHSAAVRWQALEKLNKNKYQTVDTGLLLKGLGDEHPFVRWQAGLALTKQSNGNKTLIDTLNGGNHSPIMEVAAVDALGQNPMLEAYAALVAALQNPNDLLRQSAVEALAKHKNPEAAPHLVNALKDPTPWVRRAAAYALGYLDTTESKQALIIALRDPSVLVRRSAAYALGVLRAEIALPQLKILLNDKDSLVQRNTAWALGRIGSPEAVPNLKALLNNLQLDKNMTITVNRAIQTITKPRWVQMLFKFTGRFQ